MACSKFFSGDLPELINKVIQYFHYDYKTLHSCIFVNRLWCRLAIPLLWEDPFSIKSPKNYHFISIFLHNLNENDKTKLNDYYEIYKDLIPSNTLFNYPSFIRHLNTQKICYFIKEWERTLLAKVQHSIQDTNLSTSIDKKLIFRSLFQIFIENEANLESFEVKMTAINEDKYFEEIIELILQNPNFIRNIKNFEFNFVKLTDNMTKFLGFLHNNCNSISSLYFLFPRVRNNRRISEISEKNFSQIIKSQENLKKILFGYNIYPLPQLLSSLKNSNCPNVLNTIIFYAINFKNVTILSEVFNQLNVLESVHIVYCYFLDSEFIQQISNITKPFKLKSLFLCEKLQDESSKFLMQKSGNYLENFGSAINNEPQLLQLIMKYCNKIKYLGCITVDDQSVYLLFKLIENIKQNLNYIMISKDFYYNDHLTQIILQNLGQILPFNLEYLSLSFTININDFVVFLKNSQNTFIKKLLINNIKEKEGEDELILPYIEEYIVKKKRVKYLAILEVFNGKFEDLFSLKGKVREFESHDIQVVNYDDLVINTHEFIKESY
jgi:hypothetical protein